MERRKAAWLAEQALIALYQISAEAQNNPHNSVAIQG